MKQLVGNSRSTVGLAINPSTQNTFTAHYAPLHHCPWLHHCQLHKWTRLAVSGIFSPKPHQEMDPMRTCLKAQISSFLPMTCRNLIAIKLVCNSCQFESNYHPLHPWGISIVISKPCEFLDHFASSLCNEQHQCCWVRDWIWTSSWHSCWGRTCVPIIMLMISSHLLAFDTRLWALCNVRFQ